MVGIFRKVFGNPNERALKPLREIVELVNTHAGRIEAMSDDELLEQTVQFRARLADGETLDDLLPEAFAVARAGIARVTGERAYDVQVLGAVALHHGMIAEMATGEGKTLVSTLALYLNALDGEGAHVITVNDYLAARDAQWYAAALARLGLTVGVLQHDQAYAYSEE
ncbi:MAG: preprotein translocase subunit SecA, partial [Dehalococcoidia bacterium]